MRRYLILLSVIGIEMCMRIVNTTTFRALGARFVEDTLPACSQYEFGCRDYWLCYIRQRATGANHVTATNSMGAKGDPKAVLDSKLRYALAISTCAENFGQ